VETKLTVHVLELCIASKPMCNELIGNCEAIPGVGENVRGHQASDCRAGGRLGAAGKTSKMLRSGAKLKFGV